MARRQRNRVVLKNVKRKKRMIIAGSIAASLFFVSTIFSLINIGNNKILNRIKIGNIDVSGLTKEEAGEKIENWYSETILKDIKAVYQDVDETITMEQLETAVDTDKLLREAYLVGKGGNIIKNNYDIIFTFLFSKNIEVKLNINEKEIDKKIEELNAKLPEAMEQSNYYVEDDKLIITKGKQGIKIDEEEFKKKLEETIYGEDKTLEIPTKTVYPKEIVLEDIYNEIHKEASNASISQNPIKVVPEVVGVDFAITMDEAKDILNKEEEEYVIPLKITIPEVTLEKLGQEAFPEVLGEYSTTYNMGNENRENNVKLASEKVNGTIVLPGETFSYNKVVGERTISKGYKEAAVYSGGKVVNGIGGGICQLSSTLYNAVLYANLDVTARTNHRFLTSYVTAGRDATVSWGTIDFCFKNSRNYPIKIVSDVKNGVVTVKICGIKEEKEYSVEIESKIIETIPYTTNEIKDSSLEEGAEQIKQYGSNGAKTMTYKIVRNNGAVISKTLLSSDTYTPLEQIVSKGTKRTSAVSGGVVSENTKKTIANELNPELLEAIKEL